MSQKLSAYRTLLAILALYLIAGVLYVTSAPVFEVSDEPRHIAFIQHLAQGGALPVQSLKQTESNGALGADDVAPWHQEGSQPPLYYGLMALIAKPFDRADYDILWRFNPHTQSMGRADATLGWNQMLHTDAERFPWRGTALAVIVMRLISLLFGAVAVICAYGIARELRPGMPHLPTLAAAIAAFNPMFLHIMGSVNNDTLATALASLALLMTTRMIRRGATSRNAFVLGIALGCVALTKASGLALVGTLPIAVLVADVWRHGWKLRRLTAFAIALGAPALIIAGWFYARNVVLYGEFTGTQMMAAIAGPRASAPTALALLGEWRGFMQAYIGLFGAVNIPMSGWIYDAFQGVLILAGAGLILEGVRWREQPFEARAIAAVLFAVIAVAFAALLRWTSMTLASQGRLLFPMCAAISVLLALGLERIGTQLHAPTRAAGRLLYCVALAAVTLAAPFLFIRPAYAEPVRYLSEQVLPAGITPKELIFEDKIRWLGYRIDTPAQRLAPGDVLDLTLYWQPLKKLARDYSVFIKVIGRDDVIVVETDTYPGGGMYQTTRWQSGEVIADRYRLRIPQSARVLQSMPSVLWLDIGFYDFEKGSGEKIEAQLATFDAAGVSIGRPRTEIAGLNVKTAQPIKPALATLQLAEVLSVSVGSPSGAALPFDIVWRASADFGEEFTVFVQLFDANDKQIGQGDGPAAGGAFMTRWWRAGDIIQDRHLIQLEAGRTTLPAGRYRIRYGLYRQAGGQERMPASDGARQPLQDFAIIEDFEIP